MEIIDYVAPAKVNPYTGDVAQLIAAGDGKAGSITVPADEHNKARVKFAQAANAAEKTARLVGTSDKDEEGNVILTFVLTARHTARRGKKADASGAEGETEAVETPAEEATPEANPDAAEESAPETTEDAAPVQRRRR